MQMYPKCLYMQKVVSLYAGNFFQSKNITRASRFVPLFTFSFLLIFLKGESAKQNSASKTLLVFIAHFSDCKLIRINSCKHIHTA